MHTQVHTCTHTLATCAYSKSRYT